MAQVNIYKPRYAIAHTAKSKVWPYKNSYLRRFFALRARRVQRGGLFRRCVLVATTMKWTRARRFIRPSRQSSGSKSTPSSNKTAFGSPRKRRYSYRFYRKQQLRHFHGKIKENAFRRFFRTHLNTVGSRAHSFFSALESRLDRVFFRRRLLPTVYSCNQFIHHYGLELNNKLEHSPRALVSVGDRVSVPVGVWKPFYWDLFCRVYYRRWGLYVRRRRLRARVKKTLFRSKPLLSIQKRSTRLFKSFLKYKRQQSSAQTVQKAYSVFKGFSSKKLFKSRFKLSHKKKSRSFSPKSGTRFAGLKVLFLPSKPKTAFCKRLNSKTVYHTLSYFPRLTGLRHPATRFTSKTVPFSLSRKQKVMSKVKVSSHEPSLSHSRSKRGMSSRLATLGQSGSKKYVKKSGKKVSISLNSFNKSKEFTAFSVHPSQMTDLFEGLVDNYFETHKFKNSKTTAWSTPLSTFNPFQNFVSPLLASGLRTTDATIGNTFSFSANFVSNSQTKRYQKRLLFYIDSFSKGYANALQQKLVEYSKRNEKNSEKLSRLLEEIERVNLGLKKIQHFQKLFRSLRLRKFLAPRVSRFIKTVERKKGLTGKMKESKKSKYFSFYRRWYAHKVLFRTKVKRRKKVSRSRQFIRLNPVHLYVPAYLQRDFRTLRAVKIESPKLEDIHYPFRASLSKVYSFYRAQGF